MRLPSIVLGHLVEIQGYHLSTNLTFELVPSI